MSEKTWIWLDGKLVEGELYIHKCKVCDEEYRESSEEPFLCTECEEEYSEWLDEMGYVIGEFDARSHPNFIEDPHAGTKWKQMES